MVVAAAAWRRASSALRSLTARLTRSRIRRCSSTTSFRYAMFICGMTFSTTCGACLTWELSNRPEAISNASASAVVADQLTCGWSWTCFGSGKEHELERGTNLIGPPPSNHNAIGTSLLFLQTHSVLLPEQC
jgi:hypothetical protein